MRFSYKLAFPQLKLEADSGNTHSQAIIGGLLLEGKGVERSEEVGLRYLKRSIDEGSPYGLWKLYSIYENNIIPSSSDKAIHYLKLAVKQNYLPAFFSLAMHILAGEGVEQSEKKAISLLQQIIANPKRDAVSDLLQSSARYSLAICFKKGQGVQQSTKVAAHHCKIAADLGLAEAQVMIGLMYQKGEGVPKSLQ